MSESDANPEQVSNHDLGDLFKKSADELTDAEIDRIINAMRERARIWAAEESRARKKSQHPSVTQGMSIDELFGDTDPLKNM